MIKFGHRSPSCAIWCIIGPHQLVDVLPSKSHFNIIKSHAFVKNFLVNNDIFVKVFTIQYVYLSVCDTWKNLHMYITIMSYKLCISIKITKNLNLQSGVGIVIKTSS